MTGSVTESVVESVVESVTESASCRFVRQTTQESGLKLPLRSIHNRASDVCVRRMPICIGR